MLFGMLKIGMIRARGGFTLVELLVAITIISILIMLALPLLEYAMERSRSICCANNERAFLAGYNQYLNDTRELLPPHQSYNIRHGYSFSAMNQLVDGKYIQDLSIMICPTASRQFPFYVLQGQNGQYKGIGEYLFNPFDHTSEKSPYDSSVENVFRNFWGNPGGDKNPLGTYTYVGGADGYDYAAAGIDISVFSSLLWFPRLDDMIQPSMVALLWDSNPGCAHTLAKGRNYAYFDGHVKFHKSPMCIDCMGSGYDNSWHYTPIPGNRGYWYFPEEVKGNIAYKCIYSASGGNSNPLVPYLKRAIRHRCLGADWFGSEYTTISQADYNAMR